MNFPTMWCSNQNVWDLNSFHKSVMFLKKKQKKLHPFPLGWSYPQRLNPNYNMGGGRASDH